MHKKWNKFYRQYGRFYLLPHEELEKAIGIFEKEDILNILDVGCGSGRHLIELAEKNFKVTGVDYSPAAAHEAEQWLHEKGLPGKVYIGDYKHDLKSFEDDEYDAVVSINSLQYLDSVKELEDIFVEINRVIKEGGKLFLVLPSNHSVIMQPTVPQIFVNENDLRSMLSAYFEIHELYEGNEKEWIVFATNKKNVPHEESNETVTE